MESLSTVAKFIGLLFSILALSVIVLDKCRNTTLVILADITLIFVHLLPKVWQAVRSRRGVLKFGLVQYLLFIVALSLSWN